MVILDTCALLYWTTDPGKLTPRAWKAIASTDQISISSISIWEIGIKLKKRKLELPFTLEEFTRRVQNTNKVQLVPVTEQIWMKNLDLEWKHRDPADRTIVATALLAGAPLITSDLSIRKFYTKTIW